MYGTVIGGDAYFLSRLHSYDWLSSSNADKLKALVQATELIDQFQFQCQKYAIQVLVDPTEAEIQAANAAQPDEFPRGDVNTVPIEIENAAYLIAKALLSGRDPEMDLETQTNKTSRFGQLSSSRDVDGNTLEHLSHLIPSPLAWNLIRPFLRETKSFVLS